jgi:hypothetical protein
MVLPIGGMDLNLSTSVYFFYTSFTVFNVMLSILFSEGFLFFLFKKMELTLVHAIICLLIFHFRRRTKCYFTKYMLD